MKLPKLKKLDVIEIIWHDSNIPDTPGWMNPKEYSTWTKNPSSIVKTVGIYMGHDKRFIHLVGDCDADTQKPGGFLRPINVGRGFIKEIYVLERVSPALGRRKNEKKR